MKTKDQILALAYIDFGCRPANRFLQDDLLVTPERGLKRAARAGCRLPHKVLWISELPDYLHSLDAMNRIENRLLPKYSLLRYTHELSEVSGGRPAWGMCRATAAERAKACLKMAGKWVS